MVEPKTRINEASVEEFLDRVQDEKKRQDSYEILKLMKEVTNKDPKMWGDSIIGFGSYQYKYASGREGEWFLTGFSPRKQTLTLYIMSGFETYKSLLKDLGKYTIGKSCLYIKKLEDIDLKTLRELIRLSVQHMETSDTAQGSPH
jgi:hypothetical protein